MAPSEDVYRKAVLFEPPLDGVAITLNKLVEESYQDAIGYTLGLPRYAPVVALYAATITDCAPPFLYPGAFCEPKDTVPFVPAMPKYLYLPVLLVKG